MFLQIGDRVSKDAIDYFVARAMIATRLRAACTFSADGMRSCFDPVLMSISPRMMSGLGPGRPKIQPRSRQEPRFQPRSRQEPRIQHRNRQEPRIQPRSRHEPRIQPGSQVSRNRPPTKTDRRWACRFNFPTTSIDSGAFNHQSYQAGRDFQTTF